MSGYFCISFKNGTQKLFHLRNVSAVSLEKKILTIQYNFPCVVGDTFHGKVEPRPSYERIEMQNDEDALQMFHNIQKEFKKLT